jgi:tetratricopeptide (TPR) repeat protein
MSPPRVWLAVMLLASLTHAQAAPSWIGMKVVTKYQTPLRVGGQVVDEDKAFRVYTVEEVNGGSLRLVAGSVKGWAPATEVVPFDQAIDFYTQEIRANKGASAYNHRGLIWGRRQEYDIAIADYNEAIRLDPSYASAFMNRAIAWRAKKEYDKAIADYDKAIRLDPGYASAFNNRGNALRAKKEYDKAIADFNEAIRLDPGLAPAFMNRGYAWQHKKEYDKAIADYDKAIRLDPGYALAFNNRGNAWRDKKQNDKAIADYGEAIRLDPRYAPAFYNRGNIRRDQKEYDKAIADYDEAIRLDPGLALAYDNRAWLWATCPDAKLRDGKRAVESATHACELGQWKEADHLGTLAAAYAESGDFTKAVEWQTKANTLYSDAESRRKGEEALALYKRKKPYRDTE